MQAQCLFNRAAALTTRKVLLFSPVDAQQRSLHIIYASHSARPTRQTRTTPSQRHGKATRAGSPLNIAVNAAPSSTAITTSSPNPPASTRPPPVVSPVRGDQSYPAYLWKLAQTYGGFYKSGVKAIWANHKLAKEIRERLQKSPGGDRWTAIVERRLNRSDFQLLERDAHDWKRVPIFGVLVLVLGEWLPLFMPFAPYLPPLTCRIPSQITSMRNKTADRRRWSFRKGIQEPEYKLKTDNIGQPGNADQLVQSLSNEQLYHLSCTLNLHGQIWEKVSVAPPTTMLRVRLAKKLSYLATDDLLLTRTPASRDLVRDELLIACEERGLDVVGPPEDKLSKYLHDWLKRQAEDNFSGQAMLHMLFRRPDAWK